MRVFAPTVTREFVRCPYRAHLLEAGWQEPLDWEVHAMGWIGKAVHAGLAAYFAPTADSDRGQGAYRVASSTLKRLWKDPTVIGDWDFAHAEKLVARALKAVLDSRFGGLPVEAVVGVEVCLQHDEREPTDHHIPGQCVIADMIYQVPVYQLGSGEFLGYTQRVVDWKVRKKVPYDMKAWDHDWQLWQYAWHVSQMGPVERYEIGLVTIEPTVKFMVHEVPVTSERLIQWQTQAVSVWEQQATGTTERRWTGCDVPYYPCEFKPHCHEGASLEAFYIKEEKE